MKKIFEIIYRAAFLFVYLTSLMIPSQAAGAVPASLPLEPASAREWAPAPGPEPAARGYAVASQEKFTSKNSSVVMAGSVVVESGKHRGVNPSIGSFAPLGIAPAPASSYRFAGGLEIEPITAYNLVVDSNVLSPSSYGPSAATLGAEYCNRSGSTMNDVWAYIGDRVANTPGQYPVHNATTDATFNASFPHLATPPTAVDYGDPTRFYALEHEAGTSTDAADASRYLGTLAVNECRTVYWLVSYPRKALISGSWVDVTGGVKPNDDLWLQYDFWGKAGASTSYYTRYLTLRNEISAMANKIWPNGDNKVPDQYVAAIQQVLGWDTWTPNGSGTLVYPGEMLTSQGIWYDLGNVGAGFDNNYDLVPDRNIWIQPIGDSGSYDPGCFRLVRTYGLVIVKLNDGTELLIPFVDQMYFENIPENNIGAVGLVFYEYVALDGACTAGLTPYQEVASGYDNEKFNADFGAGVPPLQSQQSNMTFDKNGQTAIGLGGTINYSMTFTLPDVDTTVGNDMTVTVGSPTYGLPLTFYETVPSGLQYVGGSASANATMTNYTSGTVATTRLYSTDSGTIWSTTDPGNVTSTSPNNLVIIQWQLAEGITSPASGPAVTGTVSFSATVPGGYTPLTVSNTACLKIGTASCFIEDTHTTLITGTARIEGTVWKDDATGGGVSGNGIMDETGAGIGDGADPDSTGVTVSLYWDANGDGDYTDPGDFLYTTTTTDASGNYAFTSLPATSGSARYIVVVDTADGDIPSGYGPTTATSYKNISLAAGGVYGDATDGSEPSDFGFAPALSLDKTVTTTTPIVVGDTIQYKIAVTNTLPGPGDGSSGLCKFTLWSKEAYSLNTDSPPGSAAANGRWYLTSNALGAPDEKFSYTELSDNSDYLGLSGYNIGNMSGSISSVQFVANLHEKINLAAKDEFEVHVYYNNADIAAAHYIYNGAGGFTAPATAGYFTSPAGTEYQIIETVNPVTVKGVGGTWEWSDLAGDSTTGSLLDSKLEFRLVGDKGAGDGDLDLDAFGIIITTDQQCSGAGTTLNPVPLTDTFDDAYFDFISADPPVSSSATGLLTWNNVGPLYPGQTRYVTVNMRAAAAGTSPATINTATSTNAKFASGLPANSPVSDTANVTIGANADTRSISGRVFDDNNTNGWQTALWTVGGAQTGYDAGDLGIQYIPVDLYACMSGGVPVINAPNNRTCAQQGGTWQYLQTMSTNASGDYSFTGLRRGYYYVQVNSAYILGSQTADVNQNGVCTTCDSHSNDPAQASGTEDLEDVGFVGNLDNAITAITRVNFGYNVASGTYNIGDFFFYDWDGDGVQDAEDEPMPNVTIRLLGADGTQITTTSTNTNGIYAFNGYPSAYYTVQVDASTLPSGVVQTKDPDAVKDNQSRFALTADDLTRDFAYQPLGSGTIGDTVFKDLNGNGVQSGTEPGISGVTVELQVDLNGDGTYVTVKTAVTDSSGKYLFTGLPAGTYRVKIDLDNAPYPNSTAIPNDAFGNDYLPSNGTTSTPGMVYQTKTLATSTSSDLTADYGFAPPASIGDTVYQDVDGDGTQDLNEPGISGVTVTLYSFTDLGDGDGVYDVGEPFYDLDGDTVRDSNEPFFDRDGRFQPGDTIGAQVGSSTTTDSSGHYQFDGLTPGYYLVQITPPAGSTLTGDPNTDGISCSTLTSSTEPPSSICDHRDGMRLYNGTNYMGADFGYQLPGSFGDRVWIDTNGNNLVDAGETGIPNITVTAVTANNVTVNGVNYPAGTTLITTTDANGVYSFQNISPGGGNATWTVTVDTGDADFPSGMTNSSDPDDPDGDNSPAHDSSTTVVMTPAGVVTNVGALTTDSSDGDASDPLYLDADFGYRFSGPTDLSGTICLETTVDGFCGTSNIDPSGTGAGESSYDSVTVYLYKLNDANSNGQLDPGETTILVATTTTNASGDYAFNDIPDGTYYIIAIGAPQDGLDLTSSQASVNAGGDGSETTSYVETLAGDGDTLSAYQVVNVTAGDTSVVDRDFAFELNGSYDFGDLPDSYATTLEGTPDGPRHKVPAAPTLYFGPAGATQASLVDSNGQPTTDASGDGADENGVLVPSTAAENLDGWTDGVGTIQFDVVGSGWLIGWIDYNRDGDFADANEMVISRSVNSGQDQNLNITAPTSAISDGYLFARFRLFSSQPALPTLAYSGESANGEVEDYRFSISGGVVTPVTLSYFLVQRSGSRINFEWSTATETSNVGFNLYVEDGSGQLMLINPEPIPSKVTDSLNRTDYSYSLDMGGEVFYIEDVSIAGETSKHGPFQLDRKFGDRTNADRVNWTLVQNQHKVRQEALQKSLRPELALSPSTLAMLKMGEASGLLQQLDNVTLDFKVRKTGIYRVTYDMLKNAGLDLAGVPVSKITLTNSGRKVPIYVSGLGRFGPGGYIEFYGEALDTIYTDTNIYTLQASRVSGGRIRMDGTAPNKNAKSPVDYLETLKVNNQRAYANYAPGADTWYEKSMLVYTTPKSWDFTFQVDGLSAPSASAGLELVVWGVTEWPAADPDHHLKVSLNGVPVADQTFNGLVEQTINVALPAGVLKPGDNVLQLTLPGDTGVKYDMVNLDKFSVSYRRLFQAQDGQLIFNGAGKAFTVTNLPTGNVVVYRLTGKGPERLNKVKVTSAGSTFNATFAGSNRTATYYVTTVEALNAPAIEITRARVDIDRPAQYVIISHPDFIAGLQPLVAARQAQGLTVSVVSVTDIYDQYSHGIFDPQAIRKFIAHAYQDLGTQYILLVGGDTYDYRNYLGRNSVSFIPSLYATTGVNAKFVPVDPLYADVDSDNVPDLAIGRFPVRTTAELDLMISKTFAYAAKDYGRTAVFASDKHDGIESFKDISLGMSAGLPADWSSQGIHLDELDVATARQQLIAAMNNGTALVNFTGHSGPTSWTFSNLFNTANAAALTNAGRPFVVVQWGCWNTYYVDPINNHLVQSFLFSGDKGAAAVLGASTLTDSQSEKLLGEYLAPRLTTPGKPIGLALQEAKDELAQSSPELMDVLLGWTLMGDPALVIEP